MTEERNRERAYAVGLDFGSLSCRGVLARLADGAIAAEAEFVYPHGVLEGAFPPGWALQDPADYTQALESVVRALLRESAVPPEAVLALGIDATASTVLALDREGVPLCQRPDCVGRPHAWPKMWKHHAAGPDAERLTEAVRRCAPELLDRYGGVIGAEALLPKLMQLCREDPALYALTDAAVDLGDWLTGLLAGRAVRSASLLGCKALWDPEKGYPASVFRALEADYPGLKERLLPRAGAEAAVCRPGQRAGSLSPAWAKRLGLPPGTALAAPQMDSYASLPGCGVRGQGTLAVTMGTSAGYMLLSPKREKVPGVCAAVEDSVLPGCVTYAAGQAAAGDMLRWYVENAVPEACFTAARERGQDIHAWLTARAAELKPGESGLLALDWWNGNKSCLARPDLSGVLLGLTLSTQPWEIYRALLEAVAFGGRTIIESFERAGLKAERVAACGGAVRKNPLLAQICADVWGRPVQVLACAQTAALGAAIWAAGALDGDLDGAIGRMAAREGRVFLPEKEDWARYDALYGEFLRLHDLFGRGGEPALARLREMKEGTR